MSLPLNFCHIFSERSLCSANAAHLLGRGDNIWADHASWNNPGIREEIKKVQLSAVEKRVYSLLKYRHGKKK